MRFVYQVKRNDCFSACLASVFDVPLHEVLAFGGYAENGKLLPKSYTVDLRNWLAPRKAGYAEFGFKAYLEMILLEMNSLLVGDTHYLLTGRTDSGTTHTVVCLHDKIIHDPGAEPGHHTIKQPCEDGYYRVGLFTVLR